MRERSAVPQDVRQSPARRATIVRMTVFRAFEALLQPTSLPPDAPPPSSLAAFYWHYARQARHLLAALFVAGSAVALLDLTIPVSIGRITTLVTNHAPATLLSDAWPQFALMAALLLVLRPAAITIQHLITNQAINPGLTNLVRWQSHWH